MLRCRPLLFVAVALLAGACFKTDAHSVVGADGSAATRIAIELDIGAFEALFGGLAESFGEDTSDQPSMSEEIEQSFTEVESQLDELYRENPGLRDRFRLDVSFDDNVLRTEIAGLTDDIEDLGVLYDNVLGSGSGDVEALFGLPKGALSDTSSEVGGGTGIFSSVTSTIEDGEFSFVAETPASGELGDDLELDFGQIEGLTPQIDIAITAPGDIIETNGEVDGRTVTWELDGTETEPLELRSEVDPSVTIDGLDAVASSSEDDGGFPVGLAVAIGVIAGLGIGLWVVLRRVSVATGAPEAPDSADTD